MWCWLEIGGTAKYKTIKKFNDRSPSFGNIAAYAGRGVNLPVGKAQFFFERACDNPPKWTVPIGTHFSIVEGTPETGQDALKRSTAVDAVGTIIYPLVAYIRLHAGIVHGIAQMLYEQSV